MCSTIFLIAALSGAVSAGVLDVRADDCLDAVHSGASAYEQCTSFNKATIAPTVVTTTVTSTYVRFNNNKYQPTSTATPIKSLTADKSGMYTVTPTIVPEYIRAGPCGVGGEDKLLQKYSSACSGYGSGPTTVTVSTATVTQLEFLPTTVSDFRLRAMFPNGSDFYAIQDKMLSPYQTRFLIHLEQDVTGAALFGLEPNSQLRLESQGALSYYSMSISGGIAAQSTQSVWFVSRGQPFTRPVAFQINSSQGNGNATVYPVEVAPISNDPRDIYPSRDDTTVLAGRQGGIWFGTPSWQHLMFEGGNKTSKDGQWELIELYAVPMY